MNILIVYINMNQMNHDSYQKIQGFLGQSKRLYDVAITVHNNDKTSQFKTNLYPILVINLITTSTDITLIPLDVKYIKHVFREENLPKEIISRAFTIIKKTPVNRLCFIIIIGKSEVNIYYIPIINPNKDKKELPVQFYVIDIKSTICICQNFNVNFKSSTIHNGDMCSFCFKHIIDKILCKECKIVYYCNETCLLRDIEHRPMCKSIANISNDMHFSNRVCANCGQYNINARRCMACKNVRYCDETCQQEDWQEHKPLCNKSIKECISAASN